MLFLKKAFKVWLAQHSNLYMRNVLSYEKDFNVIKTIIENQPTGTSQPGSEFNYEDALIGFSYSHILSNPNLNPDNIDFIASKATCGFTTKLDSESLFFNLLLINRNTSLDTIRKMLPLHKGFMVWDNSMSHLFENSNFINLICEDNNSHLLWNLWLAIKEKKINMKQEQLLHLAQKTPIISNYLCSTIFSDFEDMNVIKVFANRFLEEIPSRSEEKDEIKNWLMSLYQNPHLDFYLPLAEAFKTYDITLWLRKLQTNTLLAATSELKYMVYCTENDSALNAFLQSSTFPWENIDLETLIFAVVQGYKREEKDQAHFFKEKALKKSGVSSWEACKRMYVTEKSGSNCSLLPQQWVNSLLQELII